MSCPICGSREKEIFSAKYVVAACCSNPLCRHIWAVDAAPDAGVQTWTDPETTSRRFKKRNQELASLLINRGILRPNGRVLDVGSGTGHILAALCEAIQSLRVVAVEPELTNLGRLRAQGFTAYSSIEDVPNGAFDSVTMIEVIEHVPDPLYFLAQVQNKLVQGGMVFFTTPVGETRFGRRNTNAYDTPEHVHFFTERSIALAFAKAGFEAFRLETINQMTGPLTTGVKGRIKNLLRPVRAKIFGHYHLTGFAVKAMS